MVVLICHIHHSANNNHSFTSKHAIPLSIRAADKVPSAEQASSFILMQTNSLVCPHH